MCFCYQENKIPFTNRMVPYYYSRAKLHSILGYRLNDTCRKHTHWHSSIFKRSQKGASIQNQTLKRQHSRLKTQLSRAAKKKGGLGRERGSFALRSYSFQRLLRTAGSEFQQLAEPILQIACWSNKRISFSKEAAWAEVVSRVKAQDSRSNTYSFHSPYELRHTA